MPVQATEQLYDRVIASIRYQEQLSRIKRSLVFYLLGFVVCSGLFAFFFNEFYLELHQTEFISLLSLVATDFHAILNNFNDFGLSLVESFPLVSFGLMLFGFTLVATALSAIYTLFKNFKHLRKELKYEKV